MTRSYYFSLGYSACLFQGNFWLAACPYSGWRGEAWKDGNWQAQRDLKAAAKALAKSPRRIRAFSVTSTRVCTEA